MSAVRVVEEVPVALEVVGTIVREGPGRDGVWVCRPHIVPGSIPVDKDMNKEKTRVKELKQLHSH